MTCILNVLFLSIPASTVLFSRAHFKALIEMHTLLETLEKEENVLCFYSNEEEHFLHHDSSSK